MKNDFSSIWVMIFQFDLYSALWSSKTDELVSGIIIKMKTKIQMTLKLPIISTWSQACAKPMLELWFFQRFT